MTAVASSAAPPDLRALPGTSAALAVFWRHRVTVSAEGTRFRPRATRDPNTGEAVPKTAPAPREVREAAPVLFPLATAVLWQAGQNLARFAATGSPIVVRDPSLDVDTGQGFEPGYRPADVWSFADAWIPADATPAEMERGAATGFHAVWAFAVAGAPPEWNPPGISSHRQLLDALGLCAEPGTASQFALAGEDPERLVAEIERGRALAFGESVAAGWSRVALARRTGDANRETVELTTARWTRDRLADAARLHLWRDGWRLAFNVSGVRQQTSVERPGLPPVGSQSKPNNERGTLHAIDLSAERRQTRDATGTDTAP